MGDSMFSSRWVLLAALVSSSSFARVSLEQKQMRVASLMKLQAHAPALAFEAYQRELQYEEQNLTIDARAKNETNILADKIRQQIHSAYKAALNEHKSLEIAREEIKANIEKDLSLAGPELKEELQVLALQTLDSIDAGGTSEEVDLSNVELVMKKQVMSRKDFLNNDEANLGADPISPSANSSKDSERKEYSTKAELMESLVSDRESSRWVSTSNQTMKTAQITRTDSSISLQVKFEFLGVAVDAGPTIKFKREYTTNAVVMTEGFAPVLMNDGNFDYWKRDKSGKVLVKNGKEVKRYISFTCESQLEFETEYAGAGGFKFMGLGGSASISQRFVNSVSLASRRLALPEYVAQKSMTIKYISELCHRDFLNARFNNSLTVMASLNILMKNIVSGLSFSHPKTKCAVDEQCYNWFNNEIISLVKIQNFPRCGEENGREKFRSCQLRGIQGQNCPVYEGGKRTSDGQFEFACDTGLKCVKYESQTFFLGAVWSSAKGKCQIVNKKTYRNPFDVANESREIEVTLAD
jgi:hypothetical protein